MRRLLFCLPLFLIFIPDSSSREPVSPTNFRPVADNGATLPSHGEMERLDRRDPIAIERGCPRLFGRPFRGRRHLD